MPRPTEVLINNSLEAIMFKLSFNSNSTASTFIDRVRERGLYRTPSPMMEFDCSPMMEFDCSGVKKVVTDLSEIDRLVEFESFFDLGFPVMHDEEFFAFHDFMQGYR
jgi:hypothetical protein